MGGEWQTGMEREFDGRPLTWLLQANSNHSWRQWVDMEHDYFYLPPWNALTDGRIKYIFHATSGKEQVFNLTEDPGERRDISSDTELTKFWRKRWLSLSEKTVVEAGCPTESWCDGALAAFTAHTSRRNPLKRSSVT